MNSRKMHRAAVGGACAFGLLLASCGGGGGGSGDSGGGDSGGNTLTPPAQVTGTEVPLSATQSADAAFAFVAALAAAPSETAEPLVVGDATLASTETEEPKAVQ